MNLLGPRRVAFDLKPHDLASRYPSRSAPGVRELFDKVKTVAATACGTRWLNHLGHAIRAVADLDAEEWILPIEREVDRRHRVQYGVRDEFAHQQRDRLGERAVDAPHAQGVANKATGLRHRRWLGRKADGQLLRAQLLADVSASPGASSERLSIATTWSNCTASNSNSTAGWGFASTSFLPCVAVSRCPSASTFNPAASQNDRSAKSITIESDCDSRTSCANADSKTGHDSRSSSPLRRRYARPFPLLTTSTCNRSSTSRPPRRFPSPLVRPKIPPNPHSRTPKGRK